MRVMFKKSLKLVLLLGFMLMLFACGDPLSHFASSSGSLDLDTFVFPNPQLPAVLIYIEGHGEIVAELYPEYAPITVHNFINLVENEFYDGLTFHRIIAGFMMQGGCPYGTGMGGSETIVGEFAANGIPNPLRHRRGVLSMARSDDFNSASSQFFIIDGTASHLDGQFAAFGQVIHGMDVVDSVVGSVTPIDGNGTISEDEQPVIREIRLVNGSQIELE